MHAELTQPPHSQEAEQSVLGALLLDNRAFEQVSWLTENEFYADRHRRIWKGLSRMIEAGMMADVVTLAEYLGDDLEKAGGPAYLGELAQNTPSALNIASYAQLVRQKAVRRELAHVAMRIAEDALSNGTQDVDVLLDEAESKILRISEAIARHGSGPTDLKPLLAQVFERIDHLYHRDNPNDVTGVPTGYARIDQLTSGLQPGDLVILAGRPSMGKTALALNIAEHVAVEHSLPVMIFSMEMSGTQLATRLLSSISKVDSHKLRTGRLNDSEWSDLSDAMGKLHEQPVTIDATGALTALELRSRARRWRRQWAKVGLVVVDYLQLMEAPSKGENRATDISEITRSLKAMAKELDCPVIALSQLNRKVDDRPDKRPGMSDLRESGAIEQDADTIFFIYRQAVYTPDMPEDQKRIAEVIIGKQRNGPIGTVPLIFMGEHTRFENYTDTDGGLGWRPYRPQRQAKVSSFKDFKAAAAGDEAA